MSAETRPYKHMVQICKWPEEASKLPNITLKLRPYSAGTPRNPVWRCASRPHYEKNAKSLFKGWLYEVGPNCTSGAKWASFWSDIDQFQPSPGFYLALYILYLHTHFTPFTPFTHFTFTFSLLLHTPYLSHTIPSYILLSSTLIPYFLTPLHNYTHPPFIHLHTHLLHLHTSFNLTPSSFLLLTLNSFHSPLTTLTLL